MSEHRTLFIFKGKREHIAKLSIANIVYISTLKYHMVKEIMNLFPIP